MQEHFYNDEISDFHRCAFWNHLCHGHTLLPVPLGKPSMLTYPPWEGLYALAWWRSTNWCRCNNNGKMYHILTWWYGIIVKNLIHICVVNLAVILLYSSLNDFQEFLICCFNFCIIVMMIWWSGPITFRIMAWVKPVMIFKLKFHEKMTLYVFSALG